ncbi:MAG: polymer-forming cytoskeletal protein, partial [Candidatus Scalindua sediminis]
YLKKKGKIEISNIQVGDAIIQGKVKGNLKAVGTVEIMKRGEIYGKITCRKLIVNNGAIFDGSVEMLDAEPNHS